MAKTAHPSHRKGSAFVVKPAALPPEQQRIAEWLGSEGLTHGVGIGGAWRDADKGRVIRDYDLLLYVPQERRASLLDRLRMRAATGAVFSATISVFHFADGLKLDIEFVDRPVSPQQALRGISTGISAIAADLFTKTVWVSPDYVNDHAQSVIRPRQHVKDKSTLQSYLRKLQRKYPEYTLA